MNRQFFIGIDVGGTKISGAIVLRSGKILSRDKHPTPQGASGKKIVEVISSLVNNLITQSVISIDDIKGIGIGIPGIYDPEKEKTLVSPNLNIDGFSFAKEMRKKFNIPVATGNDVNVGLLGEQWLGGAKDYDNVVGIFPGTGIGGALIINGRLFTGTHGAATEIGHMMIDPNGVKCGCGNSGCLEALASRTAIEKNIRKELKKGKKSVITKLLKAKNSKLIKSGMLKKAVGKKDKVILTVLRKAAENLGLSCISLRHLIDPEVIIFGGGLIEACDSFILPIVEKMMKDDAYYKKVPACKIVEATLGDDAAILGAARLIQEKLGFKIYKPIDYPNVQTTKSGDTKVNNIVVDNNVYIRADGKMKTLNEKVFKKTKGHPAGIDMKLLQKICKKGPDELIFGTGHEKMITMTQEAKDFLKNEKIDLLECTTLKAAKIYKEDKNKRKAIILHTTS